MAITPEPQNRATETIFAGASQMATLMRSQDWSQTPLGPAENWSSSLKTAVGIILDSCYPMFIWWGPQFINLYNDAYVPILGQRHPEALGRSAKEIWADVWQVIGIQAESVLQENKSSWNKELLLMVERNGYMEETYFTFSYSPIRESNGKTNGVFCAVTEETERVLSDRRIETLCALTTKTVQARTIEETCQICVQILGNSAHDIPFASIYRIEDSQLVQMASSVNLANIKINKNLVESENGRSTENNKFELTGIQRLHQWILSQEDLNQSNITDQKVIENLVERFGTFPKGAWLQSPDQAILLPLTRPGQKAFGFLLVGVSPHRRLDKRYQDFFNLVAGQIMMAITNAQAHEAEHQRAEALAELDRVKTAFFNNVSHEFRTPLTLTLLNLLSNALKFTLSGEITVRLRPIGEQAELTIADTGIGIPATELPNLFKRFHRVKSAKGRTIEGSGIGLSLSDKESESESSPQTSTKILLVEDNADVRDYLQRLLSQYWQVETAANGAIALNLIQQQPPDLVLSDVMMPELDGLQLLEALRADEQTSSIPVILLSARTGEEATIEGLTAGANDYLIKPFSARELIARVRTQLQMSRLRQEQATNRFKDEFLKTVTHELQAPLVAVLGWARLLQTKSFDEATITRALAAIERNAMAQAKLVRDLLDVSSILSGNLRLKPQLVDLIALVEEAIATLDKAAKAKEIHLSVTIQSITENTILADGDRLRQVIVTLLDNAIKFTPQGGQVSFQLEHSNSEMKITVSDTGIGINPDFLPHVFDRFSQAEVPSHHTPGGVGIGLAIARHLVELHHGTIEAASAGVGQGATFTVRLPFVTSSRLNLESNSQ